MNLGSSSPAGVEPKRACTYLTDAAMAQSVHHTADGREPVEVFSQQRTVDGIGVEGGVGEGNVILIEVVAHRDLAAESVTTAVEVHLIVLIVTGLHEHGHVEVGIADGIDDANLETEVRQRHHDTVDLVAVLAELLRNLQAILTGLNATASGGCGVLGQDDILISQLADGLEELLAHVACQFGVEIGACSYDHAKTSFSVSHNVIRLYLYYGSK